jgi:hypothetical protein
MFVENGKSPPRLSSAPEGRHVGQYSSQHAAPPELGKGGVCFSWRSTNMPPLWGSRDSQINA